MNHPQPPQAKMNDGSGSRLPQATAMPPQHQNPFFTGRAARGAPAHPTLVEKDFPNRRALPTTPTSSTPPSAPSSATAQPSAPTLRSTSYIHRSTVSGSGSAAQAKEAPAPVSTTAGVPHTKGGSQAQRPLGVTFGAPSFAPSPAQPLGRPVASGSMPSRPALPAGRATPQPPPSLHRSATFTQPSPASSSGVAASYTRPSGSRPAGTAPRPASATFAQDTVLKSLASGQTEATSRAMARMSKASTQLPRAGAITTLNNLSPDELAREERLARLWCRPVGSPSTALERNIAARLRTNEEVDKFVRGMIRIQRLAGPIRKRVKNIHYRRNVAQEILKTEEFYVESLDILLCTFLEPLLKLALQKKEQLPQISSLVSNLMIIRSFNKTLLQDMRPRLEAWSENQCIGDIFVSTSMYLKSYTLYVSMYNGATTELIDCCKRHPELESFLSAQSEQASRQSIYAYLIQPVQRIPRYRLLLADLLKHTSPTHKDYGNLDKATNLVGEVATAVNSKAAEAERIAKVIEIQNRLLDCTVGLVTPSRRFLESCVVLLWDNNMKPDQAERRVILLFNDLIVEAKPTKKGGEDDKLKFKQNYHLTRLLPVVTDEESRSDHNFCISMVREEGGETMLKLFFKEKAERDKITEHLQNALGDLKVNRQKYEELVDKRARERAEKTKEMFDARYNLNSGSSSDECPSTPTAEGGKDSKWDARLKAMKDRQAALRQQGEDSPQTKSRSLSASTPPVPTASGSATHTTAQQPGGRSGGGASSRYSLPPTLVPEPSPVTDKLRSSGGVPTKASPPAQKKKVSRLSALFGGSSKKSRDKDATT